MTNRLFVVVNADNEPRKFGYESGAGHAFLVPAGFQRDPLSMLCEQSEAPAACGRTAEGERLVEKGTGDKMCARCCRVVTETMIMEAVADRDAVPAEGESLADMMVADPETVIITLDSAMAEADSEAVQADRIMDMSPGKDRDRAVAAVWESAASKSSKSSKSSKASKGAKDAGQKIARQSEWKSVKEVPEAIRCETDADYVDHGDGKGTCRSCGWVGPLKETETAPAVKAERVWCEGGKVGAEGCTKCGRSDLKTNAKTGLYNKHKTPGVLQEAVKATAMTSHWKHGRSPQNVITLLEEEEKRQPKRPPLADAPATVDSGSMSADDAIKGAAAGMYRGRTSLTRGSDMTGATPKERPEGGKPVSTTNDVKLGRHRTDVSARTDKRIVATENGVKIVDDRVGGEYGFLSSAEYEAKRDTPGWAAFKKGYWRKVRRARIAGERNKARKAASKGKRKG